MRTFKIGIYATILLLCILSWAYATDHYLKTSSESFTKELTKIEASLQEGNWEESSLTFKILKRDWEYSKNKWLMLVDHIHIDYIHESMVKLESYIQQKDPLKIIPELRAISYKLSNIYETNKLSIKNIL
jgi:hypothetical protein